MKNFFVILLLLALDSNAATYYFSSTIGDDTRTATQAQSTSTPWKTLGKASSFWASLAAGDRILFRGGETFTGTLTVSKSGGAGNPIVIGSYDTGPAIFTTFVTVNGWPVYSTAQAYTSSQIISHESTVPRIVVVDGVMREIGRWPNIADAGTDAGYLKANSSPSTTTWSDAEYTTFANTQVNPVNGTHTFDWTNAKYVHRTSRFTMDIGTVSSQPTSASWNFSGASFGSPYGYFFTNSKQTLDKDPEWYFDPSANKITLFASSSLTSRVVKVATGEYNINIGSYSNISVNGLTLQGANKTNIYVSGGANITVQNSTLQYAYDNLELRSSSNSTVLNSSITDALNFGMLVKGSSNSLVQGNIVDRSGIWAGMGGNGSKENVGISVNGSSTTVRYNHVTNSGYCNYVVNGADNQVTEYNYASNGLMVMDDGGAYYRVEDGGSGIVRTGVRFSYNIADPPARTAFHGTSSGSSAGAIHGIYMDNYSNDVTIDHNTVNGYTYGVFLHYSARCNVSNNNLYNNSEGQLLINTKSNYCVNNSYNYNNSLLTGTGGRAMTFYNGSATTTAASYGSWNNNKYFRPANTTLMNFHLDKPDDNISDPTLQQWRSTYGWDVNSTMTPPVTNAQNPSDLFKLQYNESQNTQTFALDGKTWVDMNGKAYTTNAITLAPYESAMLMNTPNVSLSNPVVVPVPSDFKIKTKYRTIKVN